VNKGGQLLYQDYLTRGPAPSAALRLKDRELQHTGWHTFERRLGRDHVATDHVAGSEVTLTHGHLGMWLARDMEGSIRPFPLRWSACFRFLRKCDSGELSGPRAAS
jgi:hypothetical protein